MVILCQEVRESRSYLHIYFYFLVKFVLISLSNGLSKLNVLVRLEVVFSCYDISVQHVNHYAMKTPPPDFFITRYYRTRMIFKNIDLTLTGTTIQSLS